MNDYEWYLEQDLDEFSGKWVAISNKKVVASSEELKEVIKNAKKVKGASFVKIPKQDTALAY